MRKFPSQYRQETLEPELARLLVPMLHKVEAMGARPILLLGPTMSTSANLVLPSDAPDTPINRLEDIRRYPQLFALESRWDSGHTNHKGGQLTTAAAAHAFLQIARQDRR